MRYFLNFSVTKYPTDPSANNEIKDKLILHCSSFGYKPYINLLNQTLMYVQHAPSPVQASFELPEILASITVQLSTGGSDLMMIKIIINERAALKLLLLKFLLTSSNFLIPEYSILIKYNPIKPIINGNKKLIDAGKKAVAFILRKDDKNTSKILMNTKDNPKIKNKVRFDLSGFKKFILFILFFFNCNFFIIPIH